MECARALSVSRYKPMCTGIWKVSATTYVIIYCSSTMQYIFKVSYGHPKYLHK